MSITLSEILYYSKRKQTKKVSASKNKINVKEKNERRKGNTEETRIREGGERKLKRNKWGKGEVELNKDKGSTQPNSFAIVYLRSQ